MLTFSRKAAVELRDRMALRLGGTKGPQATTFHSFCYALVRAHQDADLFSEPLRLLSGPEQDVAVRELLAGQIDLEADGLARNEWPDELRACLTTRGFADEVRAVLARSRELGLGPDSLARFAARTGRPDWGRPRRSSPNIWTFWTCRGCSTTRNWCTGRSCWRSVYRSGSPTTPCSWTSTRTPTRLRSGCSRRW